MKKKYKVVLGVIATLLALMVTGVALLGWGMFGDHSSYSENLASFEGLPETASDISVFTNLNITGTVVADFNIAESDFITWATANGWKIEEIKSPIRIASPLAFSQGNPNTFMTLEQGLYASHRKANGGGIDVAYNRAIKRASISRSSR